MKWVIAGSLPWADDDQRTWPIGRTNESYITCNAVQVNKGQNPFQALIKPQLWVCVQATGPFDLKNTAARAAEELPDGTNTHDYNGLLPWKPRDGDKGFTGLVERQLNLTFITVTETVKPPLAVKQNYDICINRKTLNQEVPVFLWDRMHFISKRERKRPIDGTHMSPLLN